jgi:hypothetical protein
MPKQFLTEYQMVFSKVFHNPTTRQQLKQYMTKEHNSEALEFWEQCQSLLVEHTASKEALNNKVVTIYDTFFSRTSKQQINVSADIVKRVREAMDRFKESTDFKEEDAYKVFSTAISSVLTSIEKDVFVRFIRSDQWLKYIKKHYKTESDMEKIAIHKSQLKQMEYGCFDEERDFIMEKDLQMGVSLRRDGIDWKLLHSESKIGKYVDSLMIFETRLQITDDQCIEKYGKTKTHKFVINFNCSAEDLFNVMFSSQKHKEIFEMKETYNQFCDIAADNSSSGKSPGDTQLNALMYRHVTSIGLPLCKHRESFFIASSAYIPSSQTLIECMKPVAKDTFYKHLSNETPEDDKVRMRVYAWTIVESRGDKCQYINVMSSSMGGSFTKENKISSWATKTAVKLLLPKIGRNFDKACNWYFESDKPDVGDEYRRFALLERNKDLAGNIKLIDTEIVL